MDLVRRGHFQSCDKDGGHTIRSDIAENSLQCCMQTSWLYVYRTRVIADRNFTLWL